MAFHTTKIYQIPVLDLCGFCRHKKTLYAEVHLNVDNKTFPKGVSVDMCRECFDTYEQDLDSFVAMAV